MGVRGQRHASAALYPRERHGTHCTGGWMGPRPGLDRRGKSRPPPGFDPRTVQPAASHYTDWATRPTNERVPLFNCRYKCWKNWKYFSILCPLIFGGTLLFEKFSRPLPFVLLVPVTYRWFSRNTNQMQLRNRIYYFKVYWRLNIFRAAHRSSSGAVNRVCSLWFIYCTKVKDRLRWSRGSVLAFGTQVRGFKPDRSRRIFKGEKIFSTPSFGGEVKPSVPCRRFAACKITWKSNS